uniref:Uncharacterized protein n=1 Tax=Marseillevirus sp. TaxID=2809551 RepID=A0AA96EPA3_9VIRU|nr:hypothetical protein MarFTMF_250 [Marseillevirus sp.]
MTDTGKCTDKAIASCKKQGKLCNVETGRCVMADPKKKVKGAVYDKKKSLYFPQALSFESEDGSQELIPPKKKKPSPKKKVVKKKPSPKKKVVKKKKETSSEEESEEEIPKKRVAKRTAKKKAETSSEEESEEEVTKKVVKKAPAKKVVKKAPAKKKPSCFEEGGECPDEKPICSVSDKGRGTCIKGSQKTLASKSMIKHGGLTIVGSSDVLKKLRKDYEHLEGDIKKWKEKESESEEESEAEEIEIPPKEKTPSPKKKVVKKKPSPKKKTPSPKKKVVKKKPSPKKKASPKKSKNEELLCFEEEAEPCDEGQVCSATGKCVPKTAAFLRKKKKIPLHGTEVYGTDLQFKNLAKKYASVAKARKYEVGEEIHIDTPKQASPAIKKTAKKIEEVVEEAELSEEVKQVIVDGIEAALAEGHKEERREEKGKEKLEEEEEEVKKKVGGGRKKKKVILPESESRQVEKSAEEIQQEFERCLGIQVSGL